MRMGVSRITASPQSSVALPDGIPVPLLMRQFMIAQGNELESVRINEDNTSVTSTINNGRAMSHWSRQ